jgi:glutamyl-tRNA synthetase
MVRLFDIADVNKSASAFNPDKLLWLNQQHIMRATPEELVPHLDYQLAALGVTGASAGEMAAVARAQQERAKTMREMAANSVFFFRDFDSYDPKAAKKNLTAEAAQPLREVREALAGLDEWTAAGIHGVVQMVAERLGLGLGKIAQPVRVAVSGGPVSPPIDVTLEVLGRETTLQRIDRAIEHCESALPGT